MKSQELKAKLANGENIKLLDVREPEEVESKPDPIPGTENVPMGKVFTEAAQGHLAKDEPIVTICAKGGRCEIVARELKQKGYNIDYLEGGIEAWETDTA